MAECVEADRRLADRIDGLGMPAVDECHGSFGRATEAPTQRARIGGTNHAGRRDADPLVVTGPDGSTEREARCAIHALHREALAFSAFT